MIFGHAPPIGIQTEFRTCPHMFPVSSCPVYARSSLRPFLSSVKPAVPRRALKVYFKPIYYTKKRKSNKAFLHGHFLSRVQFFPPSESRSAEFVLPVFLFPIYGGFQKTASGTFLCFNCIFSVFWSVLSPNAVNEHRSQFFSLSLAGNSDASCAWTRKKGTGRAKM